MKKLQRKRWTKAEDKFIRDNINSSSLEELSHKLNRTVSSIKDRVYRTLLLRMPSSKMPSPQIGEIFCDLTVIDTSSKKGNGYVLCKCACGNVSDVSQYHLWNGDTSTCGCGLFSIRKRGGNHQTYKWMYGIYLRNAKNRNINFNLTIDEFKKLVLLDCHYCGSEPKLQNRYLGNDGKQKTKNKQYQQTTIDMAYAKMNGLDRVDNSKEYSTNNALPCCKTCNFMKSNMTLEEFLSHIEKIHANKNRIDNHSRL